MSRYLPVPEADTFPEPEPEPEPVEMSIHEELVYRARKTCASYCVRNDLSADDLKELLEMLGLTDGEVFPPTGKMLTYCSP
jgi:hypothetical protein